jgi:hypothetical protein
MVQMTLGQKFRQGVWDRVYYVFPWIERHLLVFHGKIRQRYLIGWLAPDKTLADLKEHLSTKFGFGNHFVAWEDADQVLSWRKLDSFNDQYHLRVFKDGEIRGHYERTPEGATIDHFLEHGEEQRRDDFDKFLDGFIVHQPYQREITREHGSSHREPQFTYRHSIQGK